MTLQISTRIALALMALALTGCGNKDLNPGNAADLINAYKPFTAATAAVPSNIPQACAEVHDPYWSELSEGGFLSLSQLTTPAPKLPSFWSHGAKPSYTCVAEPTAKATGHYQAEAQRPMNWKWFIGSRTVTSVTSIVSTGPT